MKRTLIFAALILTLAAAPAAAQEKFATVDMNRIFEAYFKKNEAEKRLKEQADSYNNERKIYVDGIKKLLDEMNVLREEIKNQTLSKDVQEEKKRAFVMKGAEYEQRARELENFDRSRRRQIADAEQRMRDGIIADIRKVVDDKAKAAGYAMVFEKSGRTTAQAPVILYSQESADISDQVIEALNKNKGAAASEEKPKGKKN